MGAFARGFLAAEKESQSGAKLIGVLPEKFSKINNPQSLGIEFVLTETLTERKFHLLDKVDLFVVSPGGTGTLDEIFECMEQDYLPVDRDSRFADYSMRPILILNQNGYYDHTIAQLKYMMEQELLIPQKVAALHFYNSLEEFLAAIGRHLD
jgi:predicted Rossmann-fold nucleotide-binding protein